MGYFIKDLEERQILKAAEKDPTDVKSFLPELGKVFYRIIRKHAVDAVGEENLQYPNQFRFCETKGMVQTIATFAGRLKNCGGSQP